MKILWIGNIVLPRIAENENLPKAFVGGWMIGLSEKIGSLNNCNLCYVFDAKTDIAGKTDWYTYYGVSNKASSSIRLGQEYVSKLIDILKKEDPDVIHIWGTEYPHSLAMVEAANAIGMGDRVVVSIQGMVSIYAKHFFAYLPTKVIYGLKLKDLLQGNLAKRARIFEKKGKLEIETIKQVKHVIGRTDWDKAAVWGINPNVNYYINNETLRDEFYESTWDYSKVEIHSIFCSQAHYPIKGLHLMLEALILLKKHYPDINLYIGGKNYYNIKAYQRNAYESYIIKLIEKNGLKENVHFTGSLDAEGMRKRYLKAHVFVSPSSIENSPNSVGEAMLLGTPVVSSRVGGVHNMLVHEKEGFLYPADEPYMLAYYIDKIFEMKDTIKHISSSAQQHAKATHNPEHNLNEVVRIYYSICEKEYK